MASEEAVSQNNLKPLARLVAYSAVGVPPEIMGIGPVPAIQNVLKLAGLTLNDIDLVEVSIYFLLFWFRHSLIKVRKVVLPISSSVSVKVLRNNCKNIVKEH